MTDKENATKQGFEEQSEHFKQTVKDFFATYKNQSGGEDCIEVCLIRAGYRTVLKAEEEINRQKAEIEGLKTESIKQQLKKEMHRLTVEEIKAEAIKAFAERLKELYTDEIITDDMHCSVGVIKANIDDIAKEMLGAQQ